MGQPKTVLKKIRNQKAFLKKKKKKNQEAQKSKKSFEKKLDSPKHL